MCQILRLYWRLEKLSMPTWTRTRICSSLFAVVETISVLSLGLTFGLLNRVIFGAVLSFTFLIASRARWKPTLRSSRIRKRAMRHTLWLALAIVPPWPLSASFFVWTRYIVPRESNARQSLILSLICSLKSTRWDQWARWMFWKQQSNRQAKDPRPLGETADLIQSYTSTYFRLTRQFPTEFLTSTPPSRPTLPHWWQHMKFTWMHSSPSRLSKVSPRRSHSKPIPNLS